MTKEKKPDELVCNILLTMTPGQSDNHIQTMVLIGNNFEPDTRMLAKAIKLRCTQENADNMIKRFLAEAEGDIGDDFILDVVEAESEFHCMPTALLSQLKSRTATGN